MKPHLRARARTHPLTPTLARIHPPFQTHTHTRTPTHPPTHPPTPTHPHPPTPTHTHPPTPTHTHTHTQQSQEATGSHSRKRNLRPLRRLNYLERDEEFEGESYRLGNPITESDLER